MTNSLIAIIMLLLVFIAGTCDRLSNESEDKEDFQQLYIQERDSGIIWKDKENNWRSRVRVLEIESRNKVDVKELELFKRKFADDFKRKNKNVESIHEIVREMKIPFWINCKDTVINNRDTVYSTVQYYTTCEGLSVEDNILTVEDTLLIAGYWERKKKFGLRIGRKQRYVDINSGECFKVRYQKYLEFKKR